MTAFKYNRIDPLPVYRSLLKATTNTRELGGHRTADGKITGADIFWRSDAPVAYLAEDAETLRRHGITTLIDLRTDEEVGKKPCAYRSAGFDYNHFAITEGSKPPATFEEVPTCYMDAASSGSMADALRAAASAEGGVMFFCAAGKDRTGVLAAVILLACGVDRYSVIHNYILSREYNKTRLEAYIAAHPGTDRRIILANETSMESFITKLYEKYGSIGGYFESNGLAHEYALLRKKLISEQQ
ncbi:MAG: tyrosine-protein phosphatase [Oscillospiraceae bacterium]|nr:tyrosine-protein phosphatase [Oscillospiraceae bacterium]